MDATPYDSLGQTYAETRHADRAIARRINSALADAHSVVNVGAGTGSYEPSSRQVTAVEPSPVMLAQRQTGSAPTIRALAEALPFRDRTFDASMAVLTIHHWGNWRRGLLEMRRASRQRLVVVTWDQAVNERWWLPATYFPGLVAIDRARVVSVAEISDTIGPVETHIIPIPHDCTDGFDIGFWRRPQAYLNRSTLRSMSNFALLNPVELEQGVRRLANDLDDGTWEQEYGHLLVLDELDLGLRLVVHRIALT